jgi:hypothetical protein
MGNEADANLLIDKSLTKRHVVVRHALNWYFT